MINQGAGGSVNTLETQVLSDVNVKFTRLEMLTENNTKAMADMANSVDKLVAKLEKSDDIAREAMQSAKSAHHRLDKIEDNNKWLWRAIGSALIAIVLAAIVAAIKLT